MTTKDIIDLAKKAEFIEAAYSSNLKETLNIALCNVLTIAPGAIQARIASKAVDAAMQEFEKVLKELQAEFNAVHVLEQTTKKK